MELRLTAIHEAGHAVAHIRFESPQSFATIKPNNNIAGSVSANDDADDRDEGIGQVMSYCAGYAACVAAGYPEDQAKGGCDLDFDTAQGLIKIWSLKELSHWQSQAVELMRRPENLRAIDLIGQYLMQHGTIDDERMRTVVEVAEGQTTLHWFEAYDARRKWIESPERLSVHLTSKPALQTMAPAIQEKVAWVNLAIGGPASHLTKASPPLVSLPGLPESMPLQRPWPRWRGSSLG